MSEVVLRCPACGTTQAGLGECDACSEAEVRYFCSNHTPGLWLDAASCQQCGRSFGDPTKRRQPEARAAPTAAPRETRRPTRPPLPDRVESRRTGTGIPESPAAPVDTPGTPSLAELLVDTLEERERAYYEVEEVPRREPPPEILRPRLLPIAGCLVRLVLLVLLLIVLGLGGLFLLMGGLF